MKILYEDAHIIVVWKPAGIESQASRGLGDDVVSGLKRHIHNSSPKAGEPYVGVIHRLDKPVSGILVYAKDRDAASSLSKQVSDGTMDKRYLAVVCGQVDKNVDKFVDYLLKSYGILTLLEITLYTGRHHQIRVQMAAHGLPIWGDRKYNPAFFQAGGREEDIALSSFQLSFLHPVTGKLMNFCRMPDRGIFRGF